MFLKKHPEYRIFLYRMSGFAGIYSKEATNDGFTPLGVKGHLEWWGKNKETIK
jgi:hypothetical protein